MIKRISPDTPKVPLKDFKNKELKPRQVIDPNLTPVEIAALQKQLHRESFMDRVLSKPNLHNELEQTWSKEDRAQSDLDALKEDFEYQQKVNKELARRGDSKLFDPHSFQNAFSKISQDKFTIESRYTPSTIDDGRAIRDLGAELSDGGFAKIQENLKKNPATINPRPNTKK